jgi:hypothetical protein
MARRVSGRISRHQLHQSAMKSDNRAEPTATAALPNRSVRGSHGAAGGTCHLSDPCFRRCCGTSVGTSVRIRYTALIPELFQLRRTRSDASQYRRLGNLSRYLMVMYEEVDCIWQRNRGLWFPLGNAKWPVLLARPTSASFRPKAQKARVGLNLIATQSAIANVGWRGFGLRTPQFCNAMD